MNCEDIKAKLIDYVDDNLDDNQAEEVRLHIGNCPACRKDYEEILAALSYAEDNFNKITAPDNFMEDIKEKIKKPYPAKRRIKKSLKTVLIAASLVVAFTVTGFATNGFDFMKWWQDMSLKESQSMEQLISNGYGEHVNIPAEDKNVKVTIENVVADDTGTIISYSIEDMSKKNKYYLDYKSDQTDISVKGDFINPYEGFNTSLKDDSIFRYYKGHSILYSSEPYIVKGMIRLDPIKPESSSIEFTIRKLFYGDKGPLSTLEGTWKFVIPVTKYESFTYNLNKEVTIDGNKVTFDKITIAPTSTALTYSYDIHQDSSCTIENFSISKLVAGGKQYKTKYMGTSSSKSGKGKDEMTLEFDSMYLDNPEEIEIFIEKYQVDIIKYADYDIDMNKPFPQVFEYFGSEVSIDSIDVGDKETELALSYAFHEKQYESFDMEFRVKGHPLAYSASTGIFESYTLDKSGRKIALSNINEPMENIQPKTYITKQQITLQDAPGIEKTPPEYHKGPLVPEELTIKGYHETRYVNKSFAVKLNK